MTLLGLPQIDYDTDRLPPLRGQMPVDASDLPKVIGEPNEVAQRIDLIIVLANVHCAA